MYWNFRSDIYGPGVNLMISVSLLHISQTITVFERRAFPVSEAPLFTRHPGCSVRTHKHPLYYSNWLGKYISFWQNWVVFKGITCFKWHPSAGAVEFDTSCITQALPTSQGRRLALRGCFCIYTQPHTSAFTRVRLLAVKCWLLVNI